MSISFSSLSDQQLRIQLSNCQQFLIRSEDECSPYTESEVSIVSKKLDLIQEILEERTAAAAARAFPTSAAGALTSRAVSVSPFPTYSPRLTSRSIEANTLSTSARFEAGSGSSSLASPPRTARVAALSLVDELQITPTVVAPGSTAVVVPAEHKVTSTIGAGCSMLGSFAASVVLSPASTTPLSVPMHSAFARTISGPGTPSALPKDSAYSGIPRAISALILDKAVPSRSEMPDDGLPNYWSLRPEIAAPAYEISDLGEYDMGDELPVGNKFPPEPQPPRRRSLIAVEFASYRGSPVPDTVTEEEIAEKKRKRDEIHASFSGVNLLEDDWLFHQVRGNPNY